jgi:hypothetical protein
MWNLIDKIEDFYDIHRDIPEEFNGWFNLNDVFNHDVMDRLVHYHSRDRFIKIKYNI